MITNKKTNNELKKKKVQTPKIQIVRKKPEETNRGGVKALKRDGRIRGDKTHNTGCSVLAAGDGKTGAGLKTRKNRCETL